MKSDLLVAGHEILVDHEKIRTMMLMKRYWKKEAGDKPYRPLYLGVYSSHQAVACTGLSK